MAKKRSISYQSTLSFAEEVPIKFFHYCSDLFGSTYDDLVFFSSYPFKIVATQNNVANPEYKKPRVFPSLIGGEAFDWGFVLHNMLLPSGRIRPYWGYLDH